LREADFGLVFRIVPEAVANGAAARYTETRILHVLTERRPVLELTVPKPTDVICDLPLID
jgi:hypothetical protein